MSTNKHVFQPASDIKQRLYAVLALAGPAAATMFSYTMVGLVDTILVGHLGAAPLGAVGMSNTLFYTVAAFSIGLVQASSTLVAQSAGAQQWAKASRYYHHANYAALFTGVVMALLLAIPGGAWFVWMQADPDVIAEGGKYLTIRALGLPFLLLIIARDCYLEGLGDTKTPLKVSLLTNGVNGILDVLLIYGGLGIPAFGVTGAAWASNIAQGMAILFYGRYLRRKQKAQPELQLLPYKGLDETLSVDLLKLGWPMGLQFLADIAGWMVCTVFLGWLGAVTLAASQITIRITHPIILASRGAAVAATTLVGQALGAGDLRSAKLYGRCAVLTSLAAAIIAAVPALVFAESLVQVFTSEQDVITIAALLLRASALLLVAEATANAAYGMLQGAGDTRFPLIINILLIWGVGVPLAYGLTFWAGLGAVGVFIAVGLQMSFILAAYATRLWGNRWLQMYKSVA